MNSFSGHYTNRMGISVRFSDFWEESDRTIQNFFVPLLARVYEEEISVVWESRKIVDVEVFSVFPRKNRLTKMFYPPGTLEKSRRKSKRRIWYTGENRRPPFGDFDCYLSYDRDDFVRNNFYLPLWTLNCNWFGTQAHGFIRTAPRITDLVSPNTFEGIPLAQRDFCCAFIGNPEATRLRTIKLLEKIGNVEVFGKISGEKVSDKSSVAKNFRFSLCFENSLYPGYVSEKLLEARLSQNIPLYWGHDVHNFFTPGSYLNLMNFNTLDEFIERVFELNSNLEHMQSMLALPILRREYDLDGLIKSLREILC